MSLRVGGWLGALAIVSAWWFVSLAEPPSVRGRAEDISERSVAGVQSASAFTERLKRGLANRPAAPSPRRNPFLFGSREPAPPPPANQPPPIAPAPVAVVTPPALTLAGIATSETTDGVVRTAVVSTGRGVILAKSGDELPNGTRVIRVEEDHIVIADAAGTETILRLK